MCITIIYFSNGTAVGLGKVLREGLSSCDISKRYKVEWSDVDSDRHPVLMLSEFETETRTWASIVSARYVRRVPMLGLFFCHMTEMKFPLITCKLHPE